MKGVHDSIRNKRKPQQNEKKIILAVTKHSRRRMCSDVQRYFGYMCISLCIGLSACAPYRATPLNLTPSLAESLAALRRDLPDGTLIPPNVPLSLQSVAALAVLNDPDLIAARAQHDGAQAELLNAGLLPDPVISGGFAALLGGPGYAPAISGGLMQDVSALITYSVDIKGAKAGLAQVDAGILWQEWQVASRAEQLCIAVNGDTEILRILTNSQEALNLPNNAMSNEVMAGNLSIASSSASRIALASMETMLNTAQQTLAQDKSQLNTLLGLQPSVDLVVTPLDVPSIDPDVADQAIVTLGLRRPDLIALRYGYEEADAKLRAAIISQFLPISIGVMGGRDTENILSIGPQISLTLPLFNRNRGVIAIATATREQLAAQFSASLAKASGDAKVLQAHISLLHSESDAAEANVNAAVQAAGEAQSSFASGNFDALSVIDLEIAASDRQREAISLKTQLLTARLSLATVLGIGLPPLAVPDLVAPR
jgi:outer membrane protein TolC